MGVDKAVVVVCFLFLVPRLTSYRVFQRSGRGERKRKAKGKKGGEISVLETGKAPVSGTIKELSWSSRFSSKDLCHHRPNLEEGNRFLRFFSCVADCKFEFAPFAQTCITASMVWTTKTTKSRAKATPKAYKNERSARITLFQNLLSILAAIRQSITRHPFPSPWSFLFDSVNNALVMRRLACNDLTKAYNTTASL